MSKKKIIILSIIFLLILVCLYISLSYSYYMIGNKVVEIETAMETPECVGITTSGEAFSLNKDYAVPITNSQFLNSKKETQDIYKYTFTINSSCEGQDLNGLEIGLVPLQGSNLDISNLKYILIKTKDNNNSFTEDNINEFTNNDVKKLPKGMIQELKNSYDEQATNVYPVGLASFDGENSVSYDLYVWLGSEANNSTMNSDFKAAVVVYKEETVLDVLLKSDPGDGELIHHTSDMENSAKDGGYRYSGNQPNNYICFGKGSEAYNRGDVGATCDIKNKYRIIGYVPVTLEDGSSTSLIKVIKAEYLTEDEFGTPAGTAIVNSTYDGIKRIESSQSGIPAYQWDDSSNIWNESTLYTSLNSSDYINKAFGENWKGKIETVKWNVGGVSSSYTSYNAQATYEDEMNGQGLTATVNAQIGLMYAHDYGFASSSDNWQTEIYYHNKDENRNNNWLFNGVTEWTISRDSSSSFSACGVYSSGFVSNSNSVNITNVAVRPVFYLKSNVKIVGGEGTDGSQASPLRVK